MQRQETQSQIIVVISFNSSEEGNNRDSLKEANDGDSLEEASDGFF